MLERKINEYFTVILQDNQIHLNICGKHYPYKIPKGDFNEVCIKLQNWIENHYDTFLIEHDISFPLLSILSRNGLDEATIALKKEVFKRWDKNSLSCYLLLGGYFHSYSERDIFFGLLKPNEAKSMIEISKKTIYEYMPTIEIGESFHAPEYRTEGKLHFFPHMGHVQELEINYSFNSISKSILSNLTKLLNIYFLDLPPDKEFK